MLIDKQDIVDNSLDTPQNIENRQIANPTNINTLEGFIEVVSSVPNFAPKNFYDSIKIYNGYLYIYNQITNTWISTGGNSVISAGKGTTLPSPASSYTDQVFYKTDTDIWYRSNGTAWINI